MSEHKEGLALRSALRQAIQWQWMLPSIRRMAREREAAEAEAEREARWRQEAEERADLALRGRDEAQADTVELESAIREHRDSGWGAFSLNPANLRLWRVLDGRKRQQAPSVPTVYPPRHISPREDVS